MRIEFQVARPPRAIPMAVTFGALARLYPMGSVRPFDQARDNSSQFPQLPSSSFGFKEKPVLNRTRLYRRHAIRKSSYSLDCPTIKGHTILSFPNQRTSLCRYSLLRNSFVLSEENSKHHVPGISHHVLGHLVLQGDSNMISRSC